MKLRVPASCHEISHQGRSIAIADDGSVEAEDEALTVLMSLGVTLWDGGRDTPDVVAMARTQPVFKAMTMRRTTMQTIRMEDIRVKPGSKEVLMQQGDLKKSGAGIAVADIEAVDLAALNRPALFAFLKAKGVSVSLPITNEGLRAAARKVLDR